MIKIFYLALIALFTFADQYTKQLIVNSFKLGQHKTIIDGFFSLTYVQNTGAGFSILQNATMFLSAISILAIAYLSYLLFTQKNRPLSIICYIFIISGALGNLIDRIRLSYVVDFLDFKIFGYDYPVFNVADCLVTVGCILLIIDTLMEERNAKDRSAGR